MGKNYIYFIFLFFMVSSLSKAQNLTYIGFDRGQTWNYSEFNDNGDVLFKKAGLGNTIGFTIGHKLSKNFILEGGFYFGTNNENTYERVMPELYSDSSSIKLFTIPLRLKFRYPINRRLAVNGSIAYKMAINNSYNLQNSDSLGINYENDTIVSQLLYNNNYNKYFSLAEIGLSLDYRFSNNLIISLSAYYTVGFNIMSSSYINYNINDGETRTGTLKSSGNNLSIYLGLKFPISNVWDNSAQGQRARANNLSGIKNMSRAIFYISGGIGLTHGFTKSDNNNITPKDGSYFLTRKSKLKGFNIGYKINGNFILESGFYKQLYTNEYYIKKSDELYVGGDLSSNNGIFYTVPVTLKHQFYSRSKRFSVLPFAGISFLITKETGMYDREILSEEKIEDGVVNEEKFSIYAYRNKKNIVSFSVGTGFEYALVEQIILMLNAGYNFGFKDFNRLNVNYSYKSVSEIGNIYYKGTNFNLIFGIKIPLF